jgi:hypothetical protein
MDWEYLSTLKLHYYAKRKKPCQENWAHFSKAKDRYDGHPSISTYPNIFLHFPLIDKPVTIF